MTSEWTEEEKAEMRKANQDARRNAKPGEFPGRVLLGDLMRQIATEKAEKP